MPLDLITRLKAVREAGMVERAHLCWHAGSYNLASHQYGVAVLCHLLFPGKPELVIYALFHDTPERWTGDVPSTTMHDPVIRGHLESLETRISYRLDLPSEHDLIDSDKALLKAADRLELWLWTWEEERRGNREALGFRDELDKAFIITSPPPRVQGVVNYVRENGWTRLPEVFDNVEKD